MKLQHIDLSGLTVSPLNVRKSGAGDISDLAASIAALRVLQPLLVRAGEEGFEVIAGQRRLAACQLLAKGSNIEPIPCAILEDGDDATAIEASLAENIQHLPMDEIEQYQAFAQLVAKGRTAEDIASHFGVSEKLVKQRLAIANLDKKILGLFSRDEINGETMRALTMATKAQQKAWLKRYRDPADYAPVGRSLKQWLLGGEQISTSAAQFALDLYTGAIVTDLFGEESYFADPTLFWSLQNQAIDESIAHHKDNGWSDVVVLEQAAYWPDYEYRKVAKKQGGKVYVSVAPNGEVTYHLGYQPAKELAKAERQITAKTEGEAPTARSQLTKAATNYVDLHRHVAVQAALINQPSLMLRVLTAHLVAGSSLWQVHPDAGRADKETTRQSVDLSDSATTFIDAKAATLDLLGYDSEERPEFLVGRSFQHRSMAETFASLCTLTDDQVMQVLGIAMAETLEVGSPIIETLGTMLGIDMGSLWQADDAFLDLVTSKETLLAMLGELGGSVAIDAHKASTGKVIRSVIRQYVSGEGRTKVTGWVPPQLQFPQTEYGAMEAVSKTEEDQRNAA